MRTMGQTDIDNLDNQEVNTNPHSDSSNESDDLLQTINNNNEDYYEIMNPDGSLSDNNLEE
jgi:hypothetical protein